MMADKINWRSTKFIQSAFVQITGALALFLDKIEGGTYVALSTLALSIYAVADVAQKRITQDDGDED
jgi:hypothetical protein